MGANPLLFASGGSDAAWDLAAAGAPLALDRLIPEPVAAGAGWELEIGFGKGRYLMRRAAEHPERRFLGVEMAAQYFRILAERARKRRLGNLLAVRGEALYLLSAVLPRGFAGTIHVYHPDPWPKARHHKRRLFDPETIDLVLGALVPGGTLFLGTDHLDYGDVVMGILDRHPAVSYRRLDGPWPDGPRTNYEAKYVAEGRPILRLEVTAGPEPSALHPDGVVGIVSGWRPPEEDGAGAEQQEAPP